MNSKPTSDGNFFRFMRLVLLSSLTLLFCVSCSLFSSEEDGDYSSEEISMAEDRDELRELRKNIPEDKRHRNDQLKEILASMGELKDPPARIRSKFNDVQRKKRDRFRRKLNKERADYRKRERKNRDRFLKDLKSERASARTSGMSREDRKDFFSELDDKRKRYFSAEKDRRKEFESKKREESKDFYSEQREQNREFSAELRDYTKRLKDWKKAKAEKKKQARKALKNPGQSHSKEMDVFRKMEQVPGTPLGTDDN